MQTEITKGDKVVGLFVLGAAILGIGFAVAANSEEFQAQRRYVLQLPEAYDLNPGNNVELNGFRIGEVESMDLLESNEIRVVIRVDGAQYYERVRVDAVARIEGSIGPIKAAAIILDPGTSPRVMGEGDRMEYLPPQTSFETIVRDASSFVGQLDQLAARLNDEERNGLLELLGRDVSRSIESAVEAASRAVEEDLLPIAADLRDAMTGVLEGERSVAEIVFGPRPLAEVVFGAEVQAGLVRVATGEQAAIEMLLGEAAWGDTRAGLDRLLDGLGRSAESIDTAVREINAGVADLRPLLKSVGRSDAAFEGARSTTELILASVSTLTEALAEEAEIIPQTVRSLRDSLVSTDQLLDAFKRHWLLRGFVQTQPEQALGARWSARPNPYDE